MTLQLRPHHLAFILAALFFASAGLFGLLLRARSRAPTPTASQPSAASPGGSLLESDLRRAFDARLRGYARGEQAARQGRVIEGMSPEQVRRAWGAPKERRERVERGRRREVWVYRRGRSLVYVTFDHGVAARVERRPAAD